MSYVADTHAFVLYITGKLPERVDSIFRSAEEGESTVYIPTIVLAECLYLVENKKIDLDFGYKKNKKGGLVLSLKPTSKTCRVSLAIS